jgi:hypothetical protein
MPMPRDMAVKRAYVASIGAGMFLVAAAVAALLIFSTIVAVRGWPGLDPDDDVPALTLSQSLPGAGSAGAGSSPVVAAAAIAAGTAASPIVLGGTAGGTAGAGAGDGAGGPTARIPGGRRTQAPAAGVPVAAPAPAGQQAAPAPAATAPAPQPQPSPVGQATTGVGRTVRDTGAAVGTVTDGVLPGAGAPVREATGVVAGTVEQVPGAVQQSVGNAGQAVGALVGDRAAAG